MTDIVSLLSLFVSILFGAEEMLIMLKHRDKGRQLLELYFMMERIIENKKKLYFTGLRYCERQYRWRVERREAELSQFVRLIEEHLRLLDDARFALRDLANELSIIAPSESSRINLAINRRYVMLTEIREYTFLINALRNEVHERQQIVERIQQYCRVFSPDTIIKKLEAANEELRRYIVEHFELSEVL